MRAYISENWNQILDGLLFGLGILAVYLGAVITGAIIRSLGGAGSKGLTVLGRYATGWFDYVRGDDRNTINVTLNMVVDNHLKFDTIVSDRRIWNVWPNQYRVYLIRRAAKLTTIDNPVITFPPPPERKRRSIGERITDMLASVTVIENGKSQRIRARPRGRLSRDLWTADQPRQREVHQRRFDRSRARPADGGASFRHRVDLRAAQHAPRAPPARHGDPGNHAAQSAGRDAARRFRGAQERYRTLQAIAKLYRAHPERFGIVKVWRPSVRVPRPIAVPAASIRPL